MIHSLFYSWSAAFTRDRHIHQSSVETIAKRTNTLSQHSTCATVQIFAVCVPVSLQQLCFQETFIRIVPHHLPPSQISLFLFLLHQRKSFDSASPKLGAAMRIAIVQMMLNTLNPTRNRRSMTAAANCHCSAKLSCRSCSLTRSTKNCTSTRRACSWLSTATDRIKPLCVYVAADRPATGTASRTQGPEDVVDGSSSGDTGVSCGGFPNLEDEGW